MASSSVQQFIHGLPSFHVPGAQAQMIDVYSQMIPHLPSSSKRSAASHFHTRIGASRAPLHCSLPQQAAHGRAAPRPGAPGHYVRVCADHLALLAQGALCRRGAWVDASTDRSGPGVRALAGGACGLRAAAHVVVSNDTPIVLHLAAGRLLVWLFGGRHLSLAGALGARRPGQRPVPGRARRRSVRGCMWACAAALVRRGRLHLKACPPLPITQRGAPWTSWAPTCSWPGRWATPSTWTTP